MKKKRILLTDTLIKDFVYIYQKDYIVDKLWEKNKNKINFKEYEGMVASGVYSITDSLMEKLTNLKIISLFGVGYDNVNLKLCKKNFKKIKKINSDLPNFLTQMSIKYNFKLIHIKLIIYLSVS